jgi:hypothetical protein
LTGNCKQSPNIADSPEGSPRDTHCGAQEHDTHLSARQDAFATYMYISIHSRILHTDHTARLCVGKQSTSSSKAELRYASLLLQIRQARAICVQRLVRPHVQEYHNNPAHSAVKNSCFLKYNKIPVTSAISQVSRVCGHAQAPFVVTTDPQLAWKALQCLQDEHRQGVSRPLLNNCCPPCSWLQLAAAVVYVDRHQRIRPHWRPRSNSTPLKYASHTSHQPGSTPSAAGVRFISHTRTP